jgi:hypothetical protein
VARTLLLALLLAAPAVAGEPAVSWKGRSHAVSKLPVTMPAAARDAVRGWADWAAAHELRLDLDDEARVLIVQPDSRSSAERRLKLARRTTELCDELLPLPSRRLAVEEPETEPAAPEREDPEGLPEDPDGPPAGAGLVDPQPRTKSSWGYQLGEPETETGLLFVLPGPEEYGALLDELAERHEPLRAWTEVARTQVGFVLEWPLAAAYLLDAPGMEEWNPQNELVNRLTQLLVLRRFGRQPMWVVQGLAWQVELRLMGAIYCFPYRAEFVWATEHTGWDKEVAGRFKARKPRLDTAGLAGWERGKYDDERAKLAWATMGFLLHAHAEELSDFLETLRVTLERESRVPLEGGGWRRDTQHQLSAGDIQQLLEQAFGDDVLSRAGAWFHDGLRG